MCAQKFTSSQLSLRMEPSKIRSERTKKRKLVTCRLINKSSIPEGIGCTFTYAKRRTDEVANHYVSGAPNKQETTVLTRSSCPRHGSYRILPTLHISDRQLAKCRRRFHVARAATASANSLDRSLLRRIAATAAAAAAGTQHSSSLAVANCSGSRQLTLQNAFLSPIKTVA